MDHRCVDARSLRCPLPVIEVAKAARELGPGSIMTVVATDPAFTMDIEAWCRRTGNTLVEVERSGDEVVATIRMEARAAEGEGPSHV
ncbi:MAG: sulfurtransferase TusA family protein [Planctomycetes bacterium]|nr:sulfurtransferase TusA family protein [Planctomycetota bacterium]